METPTEKMWLWACVSDDWRLSMFAAGKKLIIGSEEWRDGFKVAVGIALDTKREDKNTRTFRLFQLEQSLTIICLLSRFSYYQHEGHVTVETLLEMHRTTGRIPQLSGFVSGRSCARSSSRR